MFVAEGRTASYALNKVMLRSDAYLDLYADKVLHGDKARLDAKLGRSPLDALAPDEARAVCNWARRVAPSSVMFQCLLKPVSHFR